MAGNAPATEAVKNALLRRVDWRFLLPTPRPAQTLCLAAGQLAEAVALISDRLADPHNPPAEACDLAVVVDPTPATLATAWFALRPGGALYGEWRAWQPGGAPALRRQVEAAGFTEAACYWAWPTPERAAPLFWLPVEAPQALDYFLASRPRAPSRWLRLRSAALQPAWRLARHARLLAPLSVIAHKPRPANSPAPVDRHPTGATQWPAGGLGPPPQRLAWLLLTGGRRSINKVVSLAFADQAREPRLIVKFAREAATAAALAHEAAALRAVHATRPGGVPGVPQVVFFDETSERLALGETVLAGQPLFTIQTRSNYRALALQVTDWLADLAGQTPPQPAGEWWPRLVEPALADFLQAFGEVLQPGQPEAARTSLASVGELPSVHEQRDCSPWNVLRDPQGGLVVLDWESAEARGLPWLDLIYFLTYWAFFLEGAMDSGRFAAAYQASLDPTTFTGRVAAECYQRYAARTGLDLAAVRPLHLLAWMIHARSEHQRFVAEAAGLPSAAVLRGSLFVSLWQQAVAAQRGRGTASSAA